MFIRQWTKDQKFPSFVSHKSARVILPTMTTQRRHSQLPEGQAQQEGPDQQDRAGGGCPCTVVVVAPLALAPVGAVTVVGEAALHLGPRVAAVSLAAEILVCAGLHHCVWR